MVLTDKIHHLLVAPAVRILTGSIFNQFVGTVARLAVAAVHQRVGKTFQVARCDPHFRIHEDGRVNSDVVGAFLNEFFPPGVLDIVFKFHTQGAVIPRVGKSPVDF